MSYVAKLQPDEFGNITQSKNYSRLTAEDFADWMRDRFNDRVLIIQYHYKDDFRFPGTVFQDLLQDLPKKSKNNLQQGINLCVDEAFEEWKEGKPKEWNNEPFDSLLVFISGALYDENYQPPAEKFTRFLDYFSPEEISKGKEHEVRKYQRVLAILTDLKMPLSFWQEQLQKAPQHNAGVCFWGACQISPYHAVSLLEEVDWKNAQGAEELLGFGITHLIDTCAKDENLKKSYQETKQKLNKHARELLEKLEKELLEV